MGGEKLRVPLKAACAMGSPPHGRGKGQDTLYVRDRYRITPAWAGKSLFCFTAAVPIQDHSRIGGEKAMDAIRQQ